MSGLVCYTGNRLEALAERLARVLKTPLPSPLDKEIVVVQSLGMERWVRMALAGHHGVCANVQFPFPNAVLKELFRKTLHAPPEDSPFDPDILKWRIMKRLPSCMEDPEFVEVGMYLQGGNRSLKLFQLSRRLADLFDQYLLYRPDMIRRWELHQADHWQARLWRGLAQEGKTRHRAVLREEFLAGVREGSLDTGELPARISIFGISALPPFHMEIFGGLSRFMDVYLFLLNPCREYWAEILSEWEMGRIAGNAKGVDEGDLHLERGNALLSSLGAQGRDFFELIANLEPEWRECFEEVEARDMLSTVQADILNLRDRGNPSEKSEISSEDRSMQVHSCHGPMREMEILKDNLLLLFQRNPRLLPKDILVMTPDIETYAPFIHAVFSSPGEEGTQIPFSIADRKIQGESPIFQAFLAILALPGGRFAASQLLSILECRAVRERFQLSPSDLSLITRWVDETGIRWGIDAGNREEMGLPPLSENTWEAGLDRLLLGYAMRGENARLFNGILPYDDLEGGEAVVLGRFTRFVTEIFSQASVLPVPRSLEGWSGVLNELLDRFFLPDESSERHAQVIREELRELTREERVSDFHGEVGLEIIESFLTGRLEEREGSLGFLTGGVTFCAMLPMRSIPFEVICLVGMDDEAYPRQSERLGFDLISKEPRKGDRSRRNDDRWLFLEALLSARKTLYISYVGQNARDNSPIPPSVLVSELLDGMEEGFRAPGEGVRDRLLTSHRLQAFNPAYFKKDERLFSYSARECLAAGRLLQPHGASVPFLKNPLPPPSEEWRRIDLSQLVRFFTNPTRFLLRERLGIRLDSTETAVDEKEVFGLEGLTRYQLEQMLLEKRLEGCSLQDLFPSVKASGRIPHGTVGECAYSQMIGDVERFADRLNRGRGKALEPVELEFRLSGMELRGRVENLFAAGLVQHRYAKLKEKDHLKLWCSHLLLNTMGKRGHPRQSFLLGKEERWVYSPLEGSEGILEGLLASYARGLVSPLHFFPETSYKYAQSVSERGKSHPEALDDARKVWLGNDFGRGECEDDYYRICFENEDPLDRDFASLALEIYDPLLAARKKERAV